jgi:acetyltransferase-like isoleucine patch superfamily enzyme
MSIDFLSIDPNVLTIQQTATSKIHEKIMLNLEGSGNVMMLGNKARLGAIRLDVIGNNNKIIIEDAVSYKRGHLRVVGDNQTFRIGKGTTIEKCYFLCAEDCNITVGEHCMFSYEIVIRTTDAHSVLDLETRERINKAESISIGNHVWLGAEVMITKGVSLPDDCIVGARSICNRSIDEPHTVIAGIPAKIVKRGVTWDRERI